MVNKFPWVLAVFLLPGGLIASGPALVYKDAKAVAERAFVIGHASGGEILASFDASFLASSAPVGGVAGESIHKLELSRFDRALNIMVFTIGEVFAAENVQKAHAEISRGVLASVAISSNTSEASLPPVKISSEPFQVALNGTDIERGEIVISHERKASVVKLKVTSQLEERLWSVDVELRSDPGLRFWKQGEPQSLNAVPVPVFKTTHQSVFVPLRKGSSFVLPIEVYFAKPETYQWKISIKTKSALYEKVFQARFEPKS